MEILNEYVEMFGDWPYRVATFSLLGEMYQYLMKEAIKSGKELTQEYIEEYIEKNKIKYDVIK